MNIILNESQDYQSYLAGTKTSEQLWEEVKPEPKSVRKPRKPKVGKFGKLVKAVGKHKGKIAGGALVIGTGVHAFKKQKSRMNEDLCQNIREDFTQAFRQAAADKAKSAAVDAEKALRNRFIQKARNKSFAKKAAVAAAGVGLGTSGAAVGKATYARRKENARHSANTNIQGRTV